MNKKFLVYWGDGDSYFPHPENDKTKILKRKVNPCIYFYSLNKKKKYHFQFSN